MTTPDSGAQSGAEGAQSGVPNEAGTGAETGTTGQSAGAEPGTGTNDATTPPATVSAEEFERLRVQLRAADQNKAKAEAELKNLRDKDLPQIEKLTRDNTELTARAEQAEAALRQTRLENAFLTDNTHTWNNPKTALRLADLSKVEVDEDGTVRNLKPALEALAKSDPYLLAPKTEGEAEKGKGSTGVPGSAGAPASRKTDVGAMASRLPALRTRGIG